MYRLKRGDAGEVLTGMDSTGPSSLLGEPGIGNDAWMNCGLIRFLQAFCLPGY
jgi:hypothetical protein